MGFLKVIKDKAYYKRYQVKYRRRRQCKTDYQARQKLITQDKNKYQTPKYRFVVRISNKDIICQVFTSDLQKDTCLAAAYSHELKRYGITVGLTNYAAAYSTGLLLARRINKKYGLDYEGCTEVTGEEYHVEGDGHGKAPFKALLDVGLAHTTTGARIFGAVKGACDGGLNVPHSTRRFPGSSKAEDSKEVSFDPEIHRKHIFGIHVADYMRLLKSDDPEKYKTQFSKYIAAGIEADDVEKMYTDAHAAIRANPTIPRDKLERGNNKTRKTPKGKEYPKKRFSSAPISVEQRKNRIKQKLTAMGKQTLPKYTLTEKAYP